MADQYSRNNCLEIRGVPEIKSENIVSISKQVASALNFKLEDPMIDAVHRLAKNPNKPDEPRGIILRFCRRLDMEEMRRKARVKRAFSASELGFRSENKVTVNLSLTKDTRILWAAVQTFKTRKNFKFSWITNAGKIFLRRSEGRPQFSSPMSPTWTVSNELRRMHVAKCMLVCHVIYFYYYCCYFLYIYLQLLLLHYIQIYYC